METLLPAAILRQSAPRYHSFGCAQDKFGYGLSASLAASDSRDVHPFTYVQPSGASLGRPRLEASRLWPLSPGLRTKPACPATASNHREYSWRGSTARVLSWQAWR